MEQSLQTVYIDTDGVNNFDLECVGLYETALLKAREDGINVRILLICNPHNPLGTSGAFFMAIISHLPGRCYPKDTLKAIMNLCAKYSLHLISDEIFALSTFEAQLPSSGVPFTSVLSCPSDLDPSNIHSMYGLSKDFAASGLRIGCVASHNADLHVSLRAIARYSWPSVVSDAMGATILEDTAWVDKFLARSHEAVAESYLLTFNELQNIGINCAKSSAAVFVWVDFSPLLPLLKSGGENNAEDMFAREMQLGTMFIDNSVFLEPASQYKGSKPGWFRFVHTCERNELLEALRRIAKVCNDIRLGHSGGL
jgi:1-aminocyclopropane-1-carboxylate synthase